MGPSYSQHKQVRHYVFRHARRCPRVHRYSRMYSFVPWCIRDSLRHVSVRLLCMPKTHLVLQSKPALTYPACAASMVFMCASACHEAPVCVPMRPAGVRSIWTAQTGEGEEANADAAAPQQVKQKGRHPEGTRHTYTHSLTHAASHTQPHMCGNVQRECPACLVTR